MTDIKLPQNVESERSLLGSLIIGLQFTDILNNIEVVAGDFHEQRNAEIFTQICRMVTAGEQVDPITLEGKLRQAGRLEYIGGVDYLLKLIAETPTHIHYKTYASYITDAARRRRIFQTAEKLARAAYAPDGLDAAVSDALTSLAHVTNPTGGAVHISEFASKLYDDFEKRAEHPELYAGMKTKLPGFDTITGGMQPGEETILSGEPGLGKSILGFQLVCGMAENGSAGVVYELEMSALAVLRRKVADMTRIDPRKLHEGRIADTDWTALTEAVEYIAKLPIYMSDESNWTTARIRADLTKLKASQNVRWFMVDHLALLSDTYGKDKNEASEYISRQLHAICKDLNLSGLVINSMNKAGVGAGTPGKEHLSGSGAIMYDADQIVFMTKNKDKPNIVTLTWDKMREGDSSRFVDLLRVAGFPAFREVYK